LDKLRDEDYLETNGRTIRRIVDSLMVEFENKIKRRIDVTDRNQKGEWIYIPNLRANKEKRFDWARLFLSR